jgi:hypothetical protein
MTAAKAIVRTAGPTVVTAVVAVTAVVVAAFWIAPIQAAVIRAAVVKAAVKVAELRRSPLPALISLETAGSPRIGKLRHRAETSSSRHLTGPPISQAII